MSNNRRLNGGVRLALMVLLPLVVAVVGVGGMSALLRMRQAPAARPAPEAVGPLVELMTVVEQPDYHFLVHSQGSVVARRESQLIPQVGGRVTKVSPSLADGGFFRPSQPLLWIDDTDYQVAVANAKLSLAQAESRLAQEQAEADVAIDEWRRLGRQGKVPDLVARVPQLAEAQAAVLAAQAAVTQADINLQRTVLLAPDYPGRVDTVSVNVGQTVSPGVAVAQLYAIDAVEVRLPLALDDIAYLDLPLYPVEAPSGAAEGPLDHEFDGPPVTFSGRVGGREWTWQGRIVRTEGRVDPRTRFIYAIARVDDPYSYSAEQPGRPPMMVGLYVSAAISGIHAGHVIALPRSVLHEGVVREIQPGEETDEQVVLDSAAAGARTGGDAWQAAPSVVYRVDGAGKLDFRRVTVLRRTIDTVYVRADEALRGGDRIVSSPLPTAVDGMQVRPLGTAATDRVAGADRVAGESADQPGGAE